MSNSETAGLSEDERRILGAALDALLPPTGSFPAPSETDIIDEFILKQVSSQAAELPPYPGIDLSDLRAIIAKLADRQDMTTALEALEHEAPDRFKALWALAVFGYYSRESVTAAIQVDLAPGYHGAPLPLGYAHVIAPWDATDPRQMPVKPSGRYIETQDVRRVDLRQIDGGSAL